MADVSSNAFTRMFFAGLMVSFMACPALAQVQSHPISQISADTSLDMNNYNISNAAYLSYNTGIVAGGVRGIPSADIQSGAITPSLISPGAIGSTKLANPLMGPINVTGAVNASYFYDYDNSTYYLDPASTGTSLAVAGNVGIGTADPELKLQMDSGKIGISSNDSYWGQFQIGNPFGGESSITFISNMTSFGAPPVVGTSGTAWTMGINPWSIGLDKFAIGRSYPYDAGAYLTIDNISRVGIGTTSPVKKLDVVGDVNATSYVHGMTGLCIGTDCKTAWSQVQGTPSGWAVSGSYIYNSTPGTKVGIGTAVPVMTVDVVGDLNYTGSLSGTVLGSNIASGAVGSTKLSNPLMGPVNVSGRVNASSFYDYENNVYYLDPASGGTSLAVAGNVGIGTASPAQKLHIDAGNVLISSDSDVALNISKPTMGDIFTFDTTSGNFTTYNRIRSVSGQPLTLSPAGSDAVTITTAGSVGIGTASPGGLLHMKSSAGNHSELRIDTGDATTVPYISFFRNGIASASIQYRYDNLGLHFQTGGGGAYPANTKTSILDNGNVGIGTVSPGARLDIHADVGLWTPAAVVVNDQTHTEFYINSSAANRVSNLDFSNNGVLKWQISSRGSYDTPNDRLSVYYTPTTTEVLSINQTGNVGIGTASPARKLHIAGGNMTVSNDSVARSDIYWDAANNQLVIRVN